jgi:histidinol phosphatase-like PHP family hydrolase
MIPEAHLREFVQAVAAHGKAIEVSRKVLPDADNPAFQAYLAMIREAGVRVSTGSDAHSMTDVGGTAVLNELLHQAGLVPASLWWPGG